MAVRVWTVVCLGCVFISLCALVASVAIPKGPVHVQEVCYAMMYYFFSCVYVIVFGFSLMDVCDSFRCVFDEQTLIDSPVEDIQWVDRMVCVHCSIHSIPLLCVVV